jgi:hypothetical protein
VSLGNTAGRWWALAGAAMVVALATGAWWPGEAAPRSPHPTTAEHSMHNEVSGTVWGAVVQAGTITGRVHVHSAGAELDEMADQLAQSVRTQWRREEERRRVNDPFPLPVRWHLAPESLMDHWPNIHHAPPGKNPGPLALTGQLDQIVEVYRRIPSGRLVVLGRKGGTGKGPRSTKERGTSPVPYLVIGEHG